MNNKYLNLQIHLATRIYQHHLHCPNIFESFNLQPNFFSNPDFQLSSQNDSQTQQQLFQITRQVKTKLKNIKTKDSKQQSISSIQSGRVDDQETMQDKILSVYDQIRHVFKIKCKNYKYAEFQHITSFKTQKISFIIKNNKQQFTIAYNFYDSLQQANIFHQQYTKLISSLSTFVPQTYAYFITYTLQEKVCLTYLMEFYQTLDQIAEQFFNNDNNGEILSQCQILEKTRNTIGQLPSTVKKLNIGLAGRNMTIKWLPFQQNKDPIDVKEYYASIFKTKFKNNELNIKRLLNLYKRKKVFQNRLYYYCQQINYNTTILNEQIQFSKNHTFIYILNKKQLKLTVKHGQKYPNFSVFRQTKKIAPHSQTQIVKVFRGSSFQQLVNYQLKQYIMTKQYSSIELRSDIFWFRQDFEIYCYFMMQKYMNIQQIFSKHKHLFENQEQQLNNSTIPYQKQKKTLQLLISQICSDISEQLTRLHSNNVIHGDVSVLNIVYDLPNKKFKLIDYQMAQRINQEKGEMTYLTNGEGFGTPKYMSEEMKLIVEKKENEIDLYKNDMDCLRNVVKFLEEYFKLNEESEK